MSVILCRTQLHLHSPFTSSFPRCCYNPGARTPLRSPSHLQQCSFFAQDIAPPRALPSARVSAALPLLTGHGNPIPTQNNAPTGDPGETTTPVVQASCAACLQPRLYTPVCAATERGRGRIVGTGERGSRGVWPPRSPGLADVPTATSEPASGWDPRYPHCKPRPSAVRDAGSCQAPRLCPSKSKATV